MRDKKEGTLADTDAVTEGDDGETKVEMEVLSKGGSNVVEELRNEDS